jgi:hypothetical protein
MLQRGKYFRSEGTQLRVSIIANTETVMDQAPD